MIKTTTEVDHELRLDQMNRARRRLTGIDTCDDGKTAIAECTEHYCKVSGRCALAMADFTQRKEGKL
jgi:hypothetical protein